MTRDDLPTPALIVQLAALDRNIATMAAWAAERGIALRPHAKTHKSGAIARRQIAAGAVGICCAKLGEAEALAAEGIDDILITSPIVSLQAISRLAELRRRIARLAIVVDHPEQVDRLAAGLDGQTIDVLVDVDPGMHRTGVTSAVAAVALAERVRTSPVLTYRGVQYYCGNLQHIATVAERRERLVERTFYLSTVIAKLRDAGLAPAVITGGGSGTFVIDTDLGVLNELQPGSYIFMDREYRDCEFTGPQFEPALMIDTRVISGNTPGCVTIDAGIKAMATEAGLPVVLSGTEPASIYRFMGDEQGMLVTPPGAGDPSLDARVTLLTPHCDPTVNLYDRYAICEGEDVIDFWPVSARGKSG
jgi:D-serine deaminase-like pyridoxal phosphate-dependent protein